MNWWEDRKKYRIGLESGSNVKDSGNISIKKTKKKFKIKRKQERKNIS